MGHLMMENRNGLIVECALTRPTAQQSGSTALDMIEDNARPGSTVGATRIRHRRLVAAAANAAVRRMSRRTMPPPLRDRRAHDPPSRLSHQHDQRKRIEEPFGWMKTVGGLRKTRHRGRGWWNGSSS